MDEPEPVNLPPAESDFQSWTALKPLRPGSLMSRISTTVLWAEAVWRARFT